MKRYSFERPCVEECISVNQISEPICKWHQREVSEAPSCRNSILLQSFNYFLTLCRNYFKTERAPLKLYQLDAQFLDQDSISRNFLLKNNSQRILISSCLYSEFVLIYQLRHFRLQISDKLYDPRGTTSSATCFLRSDA